MKKQLKSMPRRVLLMLLASIASATALAKGTKIGDLNYILDNTNRAAWVTYETESGPYYTNLPANLTIPSSVTYLDITYKVTMIDTGAFMGCTGMTSVIIPASVKQVGENAFVDCGNLISVTCNAPAPPACAGEVMDNPQDATLLVPVTSWTAYRNADHWKNFGTISPISCEAPTIEYVDGNLEIKSATEGVDCYYTIVAKDAATGKEVENDIVPLTGCYDISAWVAIDGHVQSEPTNATLYFIKKPAGTPTDVIALKDMRAIIVTSAGGVVTIKGLNPAEAISWYDIDGSKLGETKAGDGVATFDATPGSIIIVRTSNSAIKVIVK